MAPNVTHEADAWTVGRLLEWTTSYLAPRGAESPRLDAELLLARARGCERIDLYTGFSEVVGDDVRAAYRELVQRRAEGTPVAYLLGEREFFSLPFTVTPDVLIPRPETEFLVIALLDHASEKTGEGRPLRIADVGTGSGIIAVCAARNLPGARITAVDVSEAAVAVAAQNAKAHNVTGQIDFVTGDLFENIAAEETYDFIVSNPPYVSEAEFEQLAPDVAKFEPRVALVAGERGTEVIKRLIPLSAARLVPDGWLLMETSPMIEPEVVKLLNDDPRLEAAETIKDLAGHPRVVQARRTS